ncbi:LamG-like jellyroll fold domain-containing protein [Bacteroides eggerthii]|uniref:LamG-like jellyroll fold domain-containing protein n=2 Tax=Bacteroides eggerthii TaxID=28111 RepID=UPI0032193E23
MKIVFMRRLRKSHNVIALLLLLAFTACTEQDERAGNKYKSGEYLFHIGYPGMRDADTGELIATRNGGGQALPAQLNGYLFEDGIATRVLSKEELLPSGGGSALAAGEGAGERTLYVFGGDSVPRKLSEGIVGMTEEEFLNLRTEVKGSQIPVYSFFSAKVDLPAEGGQVPVELAANKARVRLLRSTVFNIEKVEMDSLAASCFYFGREPLEVPRETYVRKFDPDEINKHATDILLPEIYESKNVKVKVYGNVWGVKAVLTFNLPEVKRNHSYLLKVEAPGVDASNRKLMVVVLAGQSNASGLDESPVDLNGEEAPVPHIYQLGMRTVYDSDYTNNLKLLPMDYCPQTLHDTRRKHNIKRPNLPLGKELLKRIPKGYEVVVIDVTRPSISITPEGCRAVDPTAFTAGHNNGLGVYDEEHMLPVSLDRFYYWHEDGAFYKMMLNRVKYVLGLNTDNKFAGVVWCQGENDAKPGWVQQHYGRFEALTNAFFRDLNEAGLGNRCPRGVAGKHLWYNFTSTRYYTSFHMTEFQEAGVPVRASGNGPSLFAGYKLWNPDTFVIPPSTPEYTNETNGNGTTSSMRASHYGNGAYHKVVMPMVVECMDRNGGLFNGREPEEDSYTYKMTPEEASQRGGKVTDADVQENLLLALPFADGNNVLENLASVTTGVSLTNNGLTVSPATLPLPAMNGRRTVNTLKMTRSANENIRMSFSGKDVSKGWSAACMVYRTGSTGESQQMILGNGQNTNSPYMAFRWTSSKEKCGPYTEFLASPAMNNKRETMLLGSLHHANRVRSYDNWIHYGVVYDREKKRMKIYMNGEEAAEYTFKTNLLRETVLNTLFLGGKDNGNQSMEGELSDFFLWNKPVTDDVMYKVYLHSYWGYGRTPDVKVTPATDRD